MGSPPFLKLVLFAALPQETAVFMSETGPWTRVHPSPCPAWMSAREDRSLLLLQTGMGTHRMPGIFRWAKARGECDIIFSFGFGGGLTPKLQVGDLCLCTRFHRWKPEEAIVDPHGLAVESQLCKQLLQNRHRVRSCIDVTTPRITPKKQIAGQLTLLSGDRMPALVDMESYVLAGLVKDASIPFVTLRSISDALEDEIDFDLSSIADHRGNIRIPQFMAAVLRRPSLVRSFLRLWRHSRLAGQALGEAMATIVSMPTEQLREALKTCQVSVWKGTDH